MIADVNLATDENGSRRARTHRDVARVREHFQIDRAAHRESFFECALRCRSKDQVEAKSTTSAIPDIAEKHGRTQRLKGEFDVYS